ncbi:MAG: fumarate hydratase, partial [Promethearchaeota archaeon]
LKSETNPIAKEQLKSIIENLNLGIQENLPYCQDTGFIHFFVKLGDGFPIKNHDLYSILKNAVRKATLEIPLRPNTVDPIYERNFGDNTGPGSPEIELMLTPGDKMVIDLMLKGGGAENMSKLFMLSPVNAWNEIPNVVLKSVIEAAGKPCPPIILGIGIGGTASSCIMLGKKALLRNLGDGSFIPKIKALEENILRAVNETGIGPMGLGGNTTCLAVHAETHVRHPASFPVSVVFQCYAHRHAHLEIDPQGNWVLKDDFL